MNHLDIAPRHAGAIFGLGNTFATLAGLVSTPLTGRGVAMFDRLEDGVNQKWLGNPIEMEVCISNTKMYPLVIEEFAIKKSHLWLIFPLKIMLSFHSYILYVSLPEGRIG